MLAVGRSKYMRNILYLIALSLSLPSFADTFQRIEIVGANKDGSGKFQERCRIYFLGSVLS